MKLTGASLAILGLAALPLTPVVAKQTDATAVPNGPQPPTIVYEGHTYALLPNCFATAFVVGIEVTGAGQEDQVLVAMDYGSGVASLPPVGQPAVGAFATRAFGDAVCLNAVPEGGS